MDRDRRRREEQAARLIALEHRVLAWQENTEPPRLTDPTGFCEGGTI